MNSYPIFLFLFGGFLGWIIDTLNRSIAQKRFSEGSALHIPFLPIYGFGAILIYLIRPFLPPQTLFQFILLCLLLSGLEYIGGVFSLHAFKRRLWCYASKWNVHGHTDVSHAIIWGILGILFLQSEPMLFFFFQKIT